LIEAGFSILYVSYSFR